MPVAVNESNNKEDCNVLTQDPNKACAMQTNGKIYRKNSSEFNQTLILFGRVTTLRPILPVVRCSRNTGYIFITRSRITKNFLHQKYGQIPRFQVRFIGSHLRLALALVPKFWHEYPTFCRINNFEFPAVHKSIGKNEQYHFSFDKDLYLKTYMSRHYLIFISLCKNSSTKLHIFGQECVHL